MRQKHAYLQDRDKWEREIINIMKLRRKVQCPGAGDSVCERVCVCVCVCVCVGGRPGGTRKREQIADSRKEKAMLERMP